MGRASAFQAECRGFETRLPLQALSPKVRRGGSLGRRPSDAFADALELIDVAERVERYQATFG